MIGGAAWLIALVIAAQPAPGRDRGCAPIEQGSWTLAELDPAARLRFVSGLLEEESGRARLWSGIWGGAYGLMTAGQLAITPLQNDEDRKDGYAGAAASAVGVASLVFMPLTVIEDGPGLVDRSRKLAAAEGTCAALLEAERKFLRGAESEALGTSWLAHTGNALFNLALGAVMGLGFHHWTAAGLSLGIGVVVGEVSILTQPARLEDALESYRQGHLDEGLLISYAGGF